MESARSVEIFVAVQCLVIGLSHLVQPHAWVDFFERLRGWGHAGVFANGFLSLGFGAMIVAFHNVWHGLAAVLTVVGWAQIAKALVCFIAPRKGLRSLERVSIERAREFRVGGVVLLVIGGLSAYLAVSGWASRA